MAHSDKVHPAWFDLIDLIDRDDRDERWMLLERLGRA